MILRDRIGVDVGRKLRLEDAVAWAAGHDVRFIDVQLDTGANALGTIDEARGAAVRAGCERHGIHLGLHTSSAVNVAEYAPFVGEAVDRYLEAYVDAAALLGAEWIVVHAGFHFTSDRDQRMQAGLERLHAARRLRRARRRADPAGKPEQGTRTGRSPLPRPYGRGVALLYRPHPVAVLPPVVHRQSRASRARGRRRVCRRARSRAGSRDPPRRLLPQRLRGPPAAGRRAISISPTCSGGSKGPGSAATT